MEEMGVKIMNITLDQFRELLKTANVNTEMEVCDQELSKDTDQAIYEGTIWNNIELWSEELGIDSRIIYQAWYRYGEDCIEGIEITYENDFPLFDWESMYPIIVVDKNDKPYNLLNFGVWVQEEFPHLLEFNVG